MLGMPVSTGAIIGAAVWAVVLPIVGFCSFEQGKTPMGANQGSVVVEAKDVHVSFSVFEDKTITMKRSVADRKFKRKARVVYAV